MYHVSRCLVRESPSFVLTPLSEFYKYARRGPQRRERAHYCMRAAGRSVVNVPTTLTQNDTCRCSTTVLRVGGTHETRAASPSVR